MSGIRFDHFGLHKAPAAGDGDGVSRRAVLAAAGLLPLTLAAATRAAAGPAYSIQYVSFDDIAPSYLKLTQSWNAMGMDDQERVYITWTSTRTDGREDTALFRYTPGTGRREFLGSFIDVATGANNLVAGEQIPKGHTRITQIGRKLFMASMGFHDFKGAIDTLPQYRGAHLFSYDLDTGVLDDVSSRMPNGIVIEHQGIVALAYSPEHDLLVGLAHPLGDLVLIDVKQEKVTKVVPGIPWALNHVVSREIVVTRKGKVYTYRGPEDPSLRTMQNEVWVYDLATATMAKTGQKLKGGFWNGQAQTRDRNTIYLCTVSGELYALDVATGVFRDLGYFIDPVDYASSRKYRITYLYGISLNTAENTVVGVPILTTTGSSGPDATRLTTYNIPGKKFTKQVDASVAVFTGSNHRDSAGNLYMTAFDWDHNCKLATLKPAGT
jgi:hypothetical protein